MRRGLHDDVLQDVRREGVSVFGAFGDPLQSAVFRYTSLRPEGTGRLGGDQRGETAMPLKHMADMAGLTKGVTSYDHSCLCLQSEQQLPLSTRYRRAYGQHMSTTWSTSLTADPP